MKRKTPQQEVLQLVENGIAAARAERMEEAEEWLRQAVALDPDNERAWLWLSAVVEGIEAQRECLQRVLKINPSNTFARSGLAFLAHLREGYEYLAVRAPWMAGVDDNRTPLAQMPPQRCDRCHSPNPGWAYICSRCGAPLQPVDVQKAARQALRGERRPSLARPWLGAAILDPELAFAPEIALASPLRSVLAVALGAVALTLARWVGTMGLALLGKGLSFPTVNALAFAFARDLTVLLTVALGMWVVLSLITGSIARSRGGVAPARVHSYLIAVAISSWLSITGILLLLAWGVIHFVPQVPEAWVMAGIGGILFLYAAMLLVQAVRTAHRLHSLGEVIAIGFLLLAIVGLYAVLVNIAPAGLRDTLMGLLRVLLFPMETG